MFPADNGVYTISISNIYARDHDGKEVADLPQRTTNRPVSVYLDENSDSPLPTKPTKKFVFKMKKSYILDGIIAFCVTLLISLIEAGVVPHVKNGFVCGDPKISYKFDGDTITATALLLTCFLGPPLMIWLFEVSISYSTHHSISKKTRFILTGIQTVRWFREFLLGMAAKLFLVDCLKTFIGEPRPHFMDTCIPDAGINCVNGTYISSYTCTNTVDTDWFVREATKSFPSGHTSIGFFSAIYMILYLQNRVVHLSSAYTVPFLQTVWLFWAFMCGVTRITDHRHHWWDVLVGGFFGVSFAIFTVHYCCKNFRTKNPRKSKLNKLPNTSSENHHQSVIRLLSTSSKEDDRDLRHENP